MLFLLINLVKHTNKHYLWWSHLFPIFIKQRNCPTEALNWLIMINLLLFFYGRTFNFLSLYQWPWHTNTFLRTYKWDLSLLFVCWVFINYQQKRIVGSRTRTLPTQPILVGKDFGIAKTRHESIWKDRRFETNAKEEKRVF